MTKRNIETVSNDRCTGCAGCYNACPEEAIEMVLSAEGFYRPKLSPSRCTECGLCIKKCPVLSWEPPFSSPPEVFAAWSTDDAVRMKSTSGGVFSELAKAIIEKGGLAAGCAWNEDWEVEHVLVRSVDDLEKLRGSKYIPSKIGAIISEIVEEAENGRDVLFCGTPCQVAALDMALSAKAREKVILVDLICHSLASLVAFSHYRKALYGNSLKHYNFRGKSRGWPASTTKATMDDGSMVEKDQARDIFMTYAFSLLGMQTCYECRFQGGIRPGDITLGDFWGVPAQWNDRRGVSVVLANSSEGKAIIAELSKNGSLILEKSDFSTAAAGNPRLASGTKPVPFLRKPFMYQLVKGTSFMTLAKVYFPLIKMKRVAELCSSPKGRKHLARKLGKATLGIFVCNT